MSISSKVATAAVGSVCVSSGPWIRVTVLSWPSFPFYTSPLIVAVVFVRGMQTQA